MIRIAKQPLRFKNIGLNLKPNHYNYVSEAGRYIHVNNAPKGTHMNVPYRKGQVVGVPKQHHAAPTTEVPKDEGAKGKTETTMRITKDEQE